MGGRTPVVAIVLLLVTLVPLPYVGRLIPSVHSTTIQTFTFPASGDRVPNLNDRVQHSGGLPMSRVLMLASHSRVSRYRTTSLTNSSWDQDTGSSRPRKV